MQLPFSISRAKIKSGFIQVKNFGNKNVVHKNEEKTSELLDFLLNMGNANSFKVRTVKEAEEAIDMVFSRDHDWGDPVMAF